MKKNFFFFNSGLCHPFSEKRYIWFLVNILAALLIIFMPNLVRKCQIMCSRMRVEEIVFLRNCCQGTFSSIYIKVFFILMLFLRTKTFSEAWKMRYFFQKIFYCLHFHDKRAQNLDIYQYFFWFCKFQFYIYILKIFKVVLFYLPKIYYFKEKGVIMKSSYVIHQVLKNLWFNLP